MNGIKKMLTQRNRAIGLLVIFGLSVVFGQTKDQKIFTPPVILVANAATNDGELADSDFEKYLKYDKFLKDDRRDKYRKYKKMKKKYGFDSSAEKRKAKDGYKKYKQYKKDKNKYPNYKKYYKDYKKYKRYKKYYKPTKKYRKYRKYDKDEYDFDGAYDAYDNNTYKNAYENYKRTKGVSQANLGGSSLGPNITVGILSIERSDIRDDSFRIKANKDYKILHQNGTVAATVTATTETRVKYVSDDNFRVYDSITPEVIINKEVRFEAADGNSENMIFEIDRPTMTYNEYRGKISLSYHRPSRTAWVINTLPLEHYTWGMGEITGTGPVEYNKVMTISYRTYGYWKIKYSTRYASEGFKVDATSGNQIYRGYDWEEGHADIKSAAQATRSKIVLYDGRIAITPYSSWTDGRTRSWQEHWGSSNYPWCQSVSDPWGKHASMSTSELVNAGNHMVGLSAHGALNRAGDGWNYSRIMEYYYDGIDILNAY